MSNNSYEKWVTLAVITIFLSIGLSSCYYDYGLSTSDYDAIVTHYDKETNFGSYKTFILADTVFHLIKEGDKDDISRVYDKQMLAAVRGNLISKGYTEVEFDANNLPDLLATISVSKATWTGGGWYYPWYPGWGGWYPGWGYPGYGYTYTYETGTVFVDIMDVDDIDKNDPDKYTIPRWGGVMQGLISTSQSNYSRVINGIDQMFYQSPYLVAGNN